MKYVSSIHQPTNQPTNGHCTVAVGMLTVQLQQKTLFGIDNSLMVLEGSKCNYL